MIAARVLVVFMLAAVGIDLAALGLDPDQLGPLDLAVLALVVGCVICWWLLRKKKRKPTPPVPPPTE